MGGDNVELVRRAYEVFDTDLTALLLLLDRAIEWVSPSEALEPGIRHGYDGVRGAFAATAMAWDDPRHSRGGLLRRRRGRGARDRQLPRPRQGERNGG